MIIIQIQIIETNNNKKKRSLLQKIADKTSEFLAVPAVVGYEQFFIQYLYDQFSQLGLEVTRHHSLLEISGKNPAENIVCAHIDRHGLISLGDDEYVYAAQYMKEVKYGENNLSSRKQVEAIAKRFEGEKVYAYHPDSGEILAEGTIEACYPSMLNHDALFYVQDIPQLEQNIPLAYSRQASFDGRYLRGQIDNTISVAVVYALYEAGYQGTAYLTCEEEIGKSWLHIAHNLEGMRIDTQKLIIIDTSPYTSQSVIDNGQVIFRNRDKSAVFNPEFVDKLKSRCKSLDLPYQTKDEILLAEGLSVDDLGSTELGRLVQGSNGKWNGATVQIPTMMYHTSNETTTAKAIENYYAFLQNILIEDQV